MLRNEETLDISRVFRLVLLNGFEPLFAERLSEILGPASSGPVAPLPGARSTVQMGRHFRFCCLHAGIDPGERTPHSCRHTYGAMMIATGCPDILVKAYMGHESVATTADYAKAAPLHVAAVKGWGMGNLLPT